MKLIGRQHERPQLLPQRTLTELESLSQLSGFIKFVEGAVDAYTNEQLLRDRELSFVYLLDFQEIYAHVAPFLDYQPDSEARLSRHLPAREFFSNLEESFYLPLGTSVELSLFLRKIAKRVEALHEITLTEDLHAATDQLVKYFETEAFLKDDGPGATLEAVGLSDDARLHAVHAEALQLLGDFESGLGKLLAIVTHPKLFRLEDELGDFPFALNSERYHLILHELQARRQRDRAQLANRADAFNIALAASLNRHFDHHFTAGRLPRCNIFQVVTDTLALLTLDDHIDIQLQYTRYQEPINILHRLDDVLLKRRLSHLHSSEGFSAVTGLGSLAREAKTGLAQLRAHSRSHGGSPLDSILGVLEKSVQDPDWHRISGLEGRAVAKLREFVVRAREISGSLGDKVLRQEILSPRAAPTAHSKLRPYSPAGVRRLYGLIEQVDNALRSFDSFAGQIEVEKRSKPLHQLLTLENLGLVELRETSADSFQWTLQRRSDGRALLTVTILSDVVVFGWPTTKGLDDALEAAQSALATLTYDIPRRFLAIYADGAEYEVGLEEGEAIDLESLDRERVAFCRLEGLQAAFVSELFSSDKSYELLTGLILESPNVRLATDLYLSLGPAPLPQQLLRTRLTSLLAEHFQETPANA